LIILEVKMKIPRTSDIILMLVGLNGSRFEGKTNIHKNLYLLKVMISKKAELPFKFKPYFYGPYSAEISNGLDLLENCGLVDTRQIKLGQDKIFEVNQSNYELTQAGVRAFGEIKGQYGQFFSVLESEFDKIRKTGYHQNTRIMSTAAKVKLILTLEKKPLTSQKIRAKATQLGWKIDAYDVQRALKLLIQTRLAKRTKEA